MDNATLTEAYNLYRRKHKLLMPAEIKQIREQYGLSQRSFAKLLNWGDKTIYRYENGSLQDKAHNSLLCFLKKPQNMRQYLNDNEIIIGESQKAKLLQRIDQLENDENIGSAEISEYSHCERGYRETKQGEIISYAYAKNMNF